MWRRTISFSACLVVMLGAANRGARGADVEIVPQVAAVLNGDLTQVDASQILPGNRLVPRSEPYYLQVDVRVQASDLGVMLGVSYVAFDAQVNGDGVLFVSPGLGIRSWTANNPQIDWNGPLVPGGLFPPTSVWEFNRDGGDNPDDLIQVEMQSVTKDFGQAPFDTRRRLLQETEHEYVGSFYIELPGETGANTSADILTPYEFKVYDASGDEIAGGFPVGAATATYRVVPEPATCGLLVLSAAAVAGFLRRRTS